MLTGHPSRRFVVGQVLHVFCTARVSLSAEQTDTDDLWELADARAEKRTLECCPRRSQGLWGGNDRQLLTTAVISWQRQGVERAREFEPPTLSLGS
jgi:hypothetical protein